MKRSRKFLLIVAVLLLFGGLCFLSGFFSSHAVAEAKFDEVQPGMTEDRVREILGPPLAVGSNAGASATFGYGGFRRLRWCTMEVYFAPNHRVIGKFHDH